MREPAGLKAFFLVTTLFFLVGCTNSHKGESVDQEKPYYEVFNRKIERLPHYEFQYDSVNVQYFLTSRDCSFQFASFGTSQLGASEFYSEVDSTHAIDSAGIVQRRIEEFTRAMDGEKLFRYAEIHHDTTVAIFKEYPWYLFVMNCTCLGPECRRDFERIVEQLKSEPNDSPH